jgi:hypothetical protein
MLEWADALDREEVRAMFVTMSMRSRPAARAFTRD